MYHNPVSHEVFQVNGYIPIINNYERPSNWVSAGQVNKTKEKMKLRETNVSALAKEYGVSRCLLYQLVKG